MITEMKIIQIRYLEETDTKPARLKAWSKGFLPMIEKVNVNIVSNEDREIIEMQANCLADKYAKFHGWSLECIGFGMLPNGDFVAMTRK